MKSLSKIVESGSYSVCTALAALALGAAEPASARANVEECGTELPLPGTVSGDGRAMVCRGAEREAPSVAVARTSPGLNHYRLTPVLRLAAATAAACSGVRGRADRTCHRAIRRAPPD